MNNGKIAYPLLNKLILFMMVFVVGGTVAIGVWQIIKYVYGGIGNPAGAVIRMGMMAVFSIVIWKILGKKKEHFDMMNILQRRQ